MASRAVDAAQAPARAVIRNTVALFSAQAVAGFAGLVSLPIVFSHLGPHDFGIWVLLSGLTTVVSLADLGLGSAVVRQVAATLHDGTVRKCRITLGIGLVWGVSLAVIGAGLVLLVWPQLSSLLNFGSSGSAAKQCALVLMIGLLMEGIGLPWRGVLEGAQRYDTLAWINGATALLGAAAAALTVLSGGGLIQLAATVAVAATLRACVIVAMARRRAPELSPSFAGVTRADLQSVGRYGLRVQVTSASGAVNLEFDRFVLAGAFEPAVAGGFEIGARIVNLFRLVLVLALVALFPMAVARTTEHGPEWLADFNIAVTKYMTVIAAIGAAALFACADPLIRLWLGESNWWASACIAILAPTYAVNLASGATGILSRVEGRPGRETGYALLSMMLNLALTWPLLYFLGPAGVPLATGIGVVVGTAYFLDTYYRVTGRAIAPLIRVIWPPLAAASCAAAAGVLMGHVLPAVHDRFDAAVAVLSRGSLVLVVAGGLLALTRFISPEDIARLRGIMRRTVTPPLATAGEVR